MLDSAAAERILEAAGLHHNNIDLKLLAKELSEEVPVSHHMHLMGRSPNARKLEAICKAARHLKRLIAYDGKDPTFFHIAAMEGDVGQLRKLLDSLLAIAEDTRRRSSPMSQVSHLPSSLGSRSEFEVLAGLGLPRVYRLVFKRKPTIRRRTNGQVYGPYLDFAHQALIELKITKKGRPYSRETIARALTAARSGRRRGKKSAPDIVGNS